MNIWLRANSSIASGRGNEPPHGRITKSHWSQQWLRDPSPILRLLVYGTNMPGFNPLVHGQLTPRRPRCRKSRDDTNRVLDVPLPLRWCVVGCFRDWFGADPVTKPNVLSMNVSASNWWLLASALGYPRHLPRRLPLGQSPPSLVRRSSWRNTTVYRTTRAEVAV